MDTPTNRTRGGGNLQRTRRGSARPRIVAHNRRRSKAPLRDLVEGQRKRFARALDITPGRIRHWLSDEEDPVERVDRIILAAARIGIPRAAVGKMIGHFLETEAIAYQTTPRRCLTEVLLGRQEADAVADVASVEALIDFAENGELGIDLARRVHNALAREESRVRDARIWLGAYIEGRAA